MPKKSNVKIKAIVVIRVIVFLFLGYLLVTVYQRGSNFLTKDPMFKITDVLVDQSISFIDMKNLKSLKGRNIFSTDLKNIHRQIASQYPQISQLKVQRELPDTIKVSAKKREVFLQVRIKNQFLIVDTEGVTMFYMGAPIQGIPILHGVLFKNKIVLGAATKEKELHLAVDLLKYVQSRPKTHEIKIADIDVSNLSKIRIVVQENAQIIIDQDNLSDKVQMLDVLLKNGKINWTQVKYVDLRFKEPIINEKEKEDQDS